MITLPMAPSANVYWRRGKHGTYVSEQATAYKETVGWTMKAAGIVPLVGNVVVTLHIYRAIRKGDVDNRVKVTLDALQGFAYANDDQVVEIHAYRHDDKRNPRIEVELTERGPAFSYTVSVNDNHELFVDCQPCEFASKIQKALADIQGVDHVVNCKDWLAVVPKSRVKLDKLKKRLDVELERLVQA